MLVERASERDLPAIETLLSTAGLPLDGVAAAFETGVLVRDSDRIVAAGALERYGGFGLLRSIVVAPDRRGERLGRTIVEGAEAVARELGVTELFLLTETATGWFPRLGYVAIDREDVPDVVRGSIEFTTACATTAVAMRRTLPPSEHRVRSAARPATAERREDAAEVAPDNPVRVGSVVERRDSGEGDDRDQPEADRSFDRNRESRGDECRSHSELPWLRQPG